MYLYYLLVSKKRVEFETSYRVPDNYFLDSCITVISRALATAVAINIFVLASAIFVSKIGNEIGAAYHYLT